MGGKTSRREGRRGRHNQSRGKEGNTCQYKREEGTPSGPKGRGRKDFRTTEGGGGRYLDQRGRYPILSRGRKDIMRKTALERRKQTSKKHETEREQRKYIRKFSLVRKRDIENIICFQM
jgi:hypothetical protein